MRHSYPVAAELQANYADLQARVPVGDRRAGCQPAPQRKSF